MPLIAFNLTGAPVNLAAGIAPTLPASPAPPARGAGVDATSELRPDTTVDPTNGIVGGLNAAAFTAIQAQVAAGDVALEWSDAVEYLTGAVTPSTIARVIKVVMDPNLVITGGVDKAIVGFQLQDGGVDIAFQAMVELAVFDDEDSTIEAGAATLDVAPVPKGIILAGNIPTPGPALKVKSDLNGRLTVQLTNPNDDTVFLVCSPTFGSPLLDCTSTQSVTMTL